MTSPQRQPPPSGATRQVTAGQAAAQVAAVVLAAEIAILASLAGFVAALAAGTILYAAASRRFRVSMWGIISQAELKIRGILRQAGQSARGDVMRILTEDLGPLHRLLPPLPSAAVPRLSAGLHAALLNALADADGALERIAAALREVPGSEREQVAADLLRSLAENGLTGLTDKAGRRWNLGVYAKTATAAAIANLHAALQLAAYESAGLDVVIVTRSTTRPPCPRCAPYVGRLLSVSGRTSGTVRVSDSACQPRTGAVVATVAEAKAAGLLHIMCYDSLSPFADGFAIPRNIPWGPRNQGTGTYPAGQNRRQAERDLRQAERERAVAITPAGRAQATRRARRLRNYLG